MTLENSIVDVDNNNSITNDELILKNENVNNDDELTLNNESLSIEINESETYDTNENEDSTPVVVDSDKEDNQESKMNDEVNEVAIVNLSSNDDNTNIPTPTIQDDNTTDADLKKVDDTDNVKLEDTIPSNTNENITDSVNEESTEATVNTIENSTESINEQNDVSNSDSSLNEIDLNKMISEQLNTDFSQVEINTSTEENDSVELINEVNVNGNIETINNSYNPFIVGSTTTDIIHSSLQEFTEENSVDESIVEQINTMDSSTDSETSTESESNDDAVNIKIILNTPDNQKTKQLNNDNIKIIVTDPYNVKQTIYPYEESELKEAVNKAIKKHKSKSKSSLKKSKSKKHKKAKKTVRFNIENDTYNSDNEVIPMVDENSVESLKKEIDRLNSRIVEEIKARTILQHTLDDTIIETEKIKKEALEKSDLKIRETMEYAHRLQESMDNRINKMQNESLEKYKELQAAHDAHLEEEREIWRQIDEDARKRLQKEREEKNKAIEENKRLEKVIEKLKAQIEEETTNSERFQICVKQMLEEYEKKYREEQESRKNAEEVIDRVLEKSKDFQESVEDLNFLNRTLKDSNRELNQQLSDANSKIESKEKLINELKSRNDDLSFSIQVLKEESENSIQKIKILSTETQNITDRSIQQINEVKEENNSIYKLLDATTKKYDELQVLYNVKEEEVELLKKKMEHMNKKFKRILRKGLMRGELNSATVSSPVSGFGGNTSFEIMSYSGNNGNDAMDKGIKETPILGEPNNTSIIEDTDDSSSIHKHIIRKKASNASISSTTLSISSLLMTNQNDLNMTPILPYGMTETIKEEDEEGFEDEIIPVVEEANVKPVEIERRSSKDSTTTTTSSSNGNGNDNDNNNKKLELPKLSIQTSKADIIESILSAQDVSDGESDEDDDTDTDYKQMNDGELSTMIEKRTMEFRTDNTEYLDFIEKLKVPDKITNAKFIKRCENEEVTGCLTFEGEYSGFFNNRKLWNNAKAGTILIEPMNKKTTFSESSDDTAVAESQHDSQLKCVLCSLQQKDNSEIINWFKFKASENDSNYENICPYCREKLANVCEWYSYIRLIQNKMIKKNPKLIYSDLLDIKRKLFYSKNGITFKFQN